MPVLKNRAKMSTSTTGTGTITLGSAEDGYQTFADAGVANSDVVRYVIEDGNNFEIGTGTYTSSGTTLSRTVSESSNSNNAINLSGSATVFIGAIDDDIAGGPRGVDFDDDVRVRFGAGNDLQIYHDGTTNKSHITESGASHLIIQGQEIQFDNAAGTSLLNMSASQIEMFHSGSKKLETYPGGIQTTGTVNVNNAYTLPTADGSAGTALVTNGSGVLAFSAVGADLYTANPSSATDPTASGSNAVAIGNTAVASGENAFAIGSDTDATGSNSLALGKGAQAVSTRCLAIGLNASASADRAISIGNNGNVATATYGTSIGSGSSSAGSTAAGSGSVALSNARAGGSDSFAATITSNTSTYGAIGTNSITIGRLAKASNTGGNAIGWGATSTHEYSSAFGVNATTTTNHQVALGGSNYTVLISGAYKLPTADGSANEVLTTNGSGQLSFATAAGADLFAENYDGSSTKPSATGTNAVGLGKNAVAGGGSSLAAGALSSSAGNLSSAIGYNATVGSSGAYAAAIGQAYANGTDSFAAAIATNSSSYGATGTSSIAMGHQSKSTGNYAVAIGSAQATGSDYGVSIGYNARSASHSTVSIGREAGLAGSGSSSISIGHETSSSGYESLAIGRNVVANSSSSVAIGRYARTGGIIGKYAFASDYISNGGDAQQGKYVLHVATTNATATALTSTGTTATSTNQVNLQNNSAYAFHGTIVARQQASGGTACAAFKVEGLIRREANAGTTVLVNSATTVLDNTPSWGMALSADTTNGCLKIEVTGAASTNIRWVATIHTSEVTYA
jgi:hypothetical protein